MKRTDPQIKQLDHGIDADGYRVTLARCGSTYHLAITATDGYVLTSRFYSSGKRARADFDYQMARRASRAIDLGDA